MKLLGVLLQPKKTLAEKFKKKNISVKLINPLLYLESKIKSE